MNGAWMKDASGSQCALEGIGRTGVRRDATPPTSAKIQTNGDRQSLAGRERSSHVDVVVRVGVGGVRVHDHQYPTDHEGERV